MAGDDLVMMKRERGADLGAHGRCRNERAVQNRCRWSKRPRLTEACGADAPGPARSKGILDSDLAALYDVTVSVFNQTVERNIERFPAGFAFQLTREEHETLRSQIVISRTERRGGRQYLPFAFAEHRAVMAASILNSPKAGEMSVEGGRAFRLFWRWRARAPLPTEGDISITRPRIPAPAGSRSDVPAVRSSSRRRARLCSSLWAGGSFPGDRAGQLTVGA